MDDFSSDDTTTGQLSIGGTSGGELEEIGDTDWFAITLEAGMHYEFNQTGAFSGGGTLDDPYLELYDRSGNFLAGNDDYDSLDSKIIGIQAQYSGTYYLSAGAYSFDDFGTYTVSAFELFDLISADTDTVGEIGVNESVEGVFDYDLDDDWYAITLAQDERIQVTIADSVDTPFALWIPRVSIYDATGALLTDSPDFYENVWGIDEFQAEYDGTYYIGATDYALYPTDYVLQVLSLAPILETGTEERDTLTGGAGDDELIGLGRADRIEGYGGDDFLDGGDGSDELLGGAGDDTILGGDGNDAIAASDGNDSVDGGAGNDIIGGGLGDDILRGGDGRDGIKAGDGDDLVIGGEGNDRLAGGWGHDVLIGGAGNDDIGGGDGRDTIYAGQGNDTVGGGYSGDIMILGAGDDVAYGGEGADWISGGTGDDILFGGTTYNYYYYYYSTSPDDTLIGGAGDDIMTGGGGADSFVFDVFNMGEVDQITDFALYEDNLILSGIAGDDPEAQFAALTFSDVDGGTLIEYEGHTINLDNVLSADLGLDHFVFL
ncbi:calcium-binding protein [Puniceibacterium sp. IMCC21224]|uniref:calcium-binding protein n=1 Tax=Puniceibacterium sp. IMCC21224 TaxID=1618204 RepID=UPI00065D1CDD|nr:calcium-binding protein [Puniceibacterium sp. IMCC21224]KMK68403.1 putative calcium-binding protein [Puniceibacterium sp. IMCC21224]